MIPKQHHLRYQNSTNHLFHLNFKLANLDLSGIYCFTEAKAVLKTPETN